MKYERRREDLVDAVQWTGANIDEVRALVALDPGATMCGSDAGDGVLTVIGTFQGTAVHVGDWLTREGDLYFSYDEDDFARTFCPAFGGPNLTGCTVSSPVTTDWYDGPLQEMSVVDFDDGAERMLELSSLGWRRDDRMVTMRLSREDLLRALDALNGRAVLDFHDEPHVFAPRSKP